MSFKVGDKVTYNHAFGRSEGTVKAVEHVTDRHGNPKHVRILIDTKNGRRVSRKAENVQPLPIDLSRFSSAEEATNGE